MEHLLHWSVFVSGQCSQVNPDIERAFRSRYKIVPTKTKTRISQISTCKSIHVTQKLSIYTCPKCNRFYKQSSCLRRHLRENCGKALKYQCDICQEWFKYSFYLTTHMKKHFEEPQHHCQFCTRKFYRKDQLTEHHRKFHITLWVVTNNRNYFSLR